MTDVSKYLKPNETCWVQYNDADGTPRYIVITKNIYRDKYYLIDVSGKKRKEIAQSVNPLKLEAKINVKQFVTSKRGIKLKSEGGDRWVGINSGKDDKSIQTKAARNKRH